MQSSNAHCRELRLQVNHSTEFLPRTPAIPRKKKGAAKSEGERSGGGEGALRGARKAICETSLRFLVSTRRRLIGASNEFLRRVSVEIPEEEKEEGREEGERQRKRRESL